MSFPEYQYPDELPKNIEQSRVSFAWDPWGEKFENQYIRIEIQLKLEGSLDWKFYILEGNLPCFGAGMRVFSSLIFEKLVGYGSRVQNNRFTENPKP